MDQYQYYEPGSSLEEYEEELKQALVQQHQDLYDEL